MNRSHHCFALLLFVFGCSPSDPVAQGRVSTVLAGRLYAALRGEAREVRVVDLGPIEGKGAPSEACRTTIDGEGRWSCDLGARADAFRVEVGLERAHALTAWVTDVALGEKREDISVTPITELAAADTEYLMGRGVPRGEAVARARKDVYDHFAGLGHDRLEPFDVWNQRPTALDEGVVAGVLLAGLERLSADASSTEAVGQGDIAALTAALGADVRADGVFDGRGEGGRRLVAGGATLQQGLLLGPYADAVEAWLRDAQERLGFGPEDFSGLVEGLRHRSSSVFPEPLAVAPAFTSISLLRDGTALPEGVPLAGTVVLEVHVRGDEPSTQLSAVIRGEPGAVQALDRGRWVLKTAMLPDGNHDLDLEIATTRGETTRTSLAFVSDNTPPELQVSAPSLVPVGSATISGSTTDATSGIDHLEVNPGSIRVEHPDAMFEIAVPFLCARNANITVTAFDRAGNASHQQVAIECDNTAPIIRWVPQTFVQEGSLTPTFASDGSISGWQRQGPVEALKLGAATAWPVTFEKYRHRLGPDADNLPGLRWLVGEGETRLRVEYRYAVDDVERRAWTELPPLWSGGREYVLPISTGTLSDALAVSPASALHRVFVRATDPAGNVATLEVAFHMRLLSPPVWLGNCHRADSLAQYDLPHRTLGAFYASSSRVMSGTIRYAIDAPSGDMPAPVLATFSGGEVSSTVNEMVDLRFDYLARQQEIACDGGYHQVFDGLDRPGPCVRGRIPVWSYVADASRTDHTRRFVLEREGAPVLANLAGAYAVEPNTPYTVTLIVEQPRLTVAGAPFDWSLPEPQANPAVEPHQAEVASFVLPGEIEHGMIFDPAPWGGPPYYRYRIRRYLGGVQVQSEPVTLSARDSVMPDVEIGLYRDCSCDQALTLISSRASVRATQ